MDVDPDLDWLRDLKTVEATSAGGSLIIDG